ncbi:hypothetical protein Taro_054581 [Colocasia esculenta]|uniref:Uncharacterized protein n=1 Tax=Colocasia esculenta TaxID=4460 RepID=A0A843XP84_COLES|nr:hypothetical protein [Colocasia esculenta]
MESSLQSLLLALNSSTSIRATCSWSTRRHTTLENHIGGRRKQVERARPTGKVQRRTSAPMNLSKRKVLLDGRRKPKSGFATRVRALRKMLPGGEYSVGLDDLFNDVADYITCLRMQVNVMQAMVDVLSSSAS